MKTSPAAADILNGELDNLGFRQDRQVNEVAGSLLNLGLTRAQAAVIADMLFLVHCHKGQTLPELEERNRHFGKYNVPDAVARKAEKYANRTR
jgi:hypothetical protein